MRIRTMGTCVLPVTCLLAACSGDDNAGMAAATDSGAKDAAVAIDSGSPEASPSADAAPDVSSQPDAQSQPDGEAADGATAGDSAAEAGPQGPANAVYTMSNAASGNAVLGFFRADDGSLMPMPAPFPTGGLGSGKGLGEQGALAYDRTNNLVYAVNAGDGSFSVFPVKADGTLGAAVKVDASAVGGSGALIGPKSVTFSGSAVYVLFEGNATTASRIAGWTVSQGTGVPAATAITGGVLELSSATQGVDPAQIEFSPDGKWLVVTEKQSGAGGSVSGAGSIDTFGVDANGVATKMGFYPTASAAGGGFQKTPFGFEFYKDVLIVSEAGSTGAGTYTYAGGVVAPVNASTQFLPTDGAPCWVAVASNWAYVANAKGPDISGFTVETTGGLTNIGAVTNAVVASTGKIVPTDAGTTILGPTDEFVSIDGKYLYVLNAGVPSIGVFQIGAGGFLERVGAGDYTPSSAAALTVGSAGIVAR